MEAGVNIIFKSEDYQIDFYRCALATKCVAFTFSEFSSRTLSGSGFAAKFILENGFDLIAIKSRTDNWYQDLPREALKAINTYLDTLVCLHTWRAGYGSSMGAYGAIAYSKELRLDVVMALSPQVDITKPWDIRWASDGKRIGIMRPIDATTISKTCKYVVAYDPIDTDRRHYELLKSVIAEDRIVPIKVILSGHPSGYFLSASNILKRISLAALTGSDLTFASDIIREARKSSSLYLFNLAGYCSQKGRHNWAERVISAALKTAPTNAEYNIRASQIFDHLGQTERALTCAALAVACNPRHADMTAVLSLLLNKLKLYKQALHYIEIAISLSPHSKAFVQQKTRIMTSIELKA